MQQGYIKLHRQIMENKLWRAEPFTRAQAWIDMLLLANYQDGCIYIRGNRVEIERGCLAWSEDKLAVRWRWSRGKVRRFLKMLKTVQQIVQQKSNVTSLIYIQNYPHYQGNGTQHGTADGTTDGQQTDSRRYPINNNKNVKNDKKEYIYTSAFLKFWESYPKKVGKGAAYSSWKKIKNIDSVLPTLLDAISIQRDTDQWKRDGGQYIPNPATWLTQRRWEDEGVCYVSSDPFEEFVKGRKDDTRSL